MTTLQQGRVSLSREDLYEKVWSISVTKLAKSYLRNIRRLMTRRQQVIESGSELGAFLVWAEQVACRFDPLHPSETSVTQRKTTRDNPII